MAPAGRRNIRSHEPCAERRQCCRVITPECLTDRSAFARAVGAASAKVRLKGNLASIRRGVHFDSVSHASLLKMTKSKRRAPTICRIGSNSTAKTSGLVRWDSEGMRLEFTNKTKRAAFARSGETCECHLIPWLNRPNGCGQRLVDGRIRYEHINPDAMRPDNSLANAAVLVIPCWREKTDKHDLPTIAKNNRVRDRARGIRKGKQPFRGWRGFDGRAIRNPRLHQS